MLKLQLKGPPFREQALPIAPGKPCPPPLLVTILATLCLAAPDADQLSTD